MLGHGHRPRSHHRPGADRGERRVRDERTGAGLGAPRPACGSGTQRRAGCRDRTGTRRRPAAIPAHRADRHHAGEHADRRVRWRADRERPDGVARHRAGAGVGGGDAVAGAGGRGDDLSDPGAGRTGAEAPGAAPAGAHRGPRGARDRLDGARHQPGRLAARQVVGRGAAPVRPASCAAADGDRGGTEGAARRRARRPACWRPRSAT